MSALPQLEDRLMVQRLRRAWPALAGADLARRSQPQALVSGSLSVTVDNSTWLHELTLRAPDLTERVRAQFPAVQSLRFVLGTAVAEETTAEPRPVPRRAALTADDRRAIDEATAAIPDPALAASARRLLARAWPPAARGDER